MAAKRTGTKERSDSPRKTRILLERLSRSAQAEVAQLLKGNRAGSITGVKMQIGLKEVQKRLKRMDSFIWDYDLW